ncbi:MAG: hypothetical protein M1816_000583 [Peltula sp. TS41687]|nr:MAG: hypothetical protein M1816_000583 [Peltula sp. TS41687]
MTAVFAASRIPPLPPSPVIAAAVSYKKDLLMKRSQWCSICSTRCLAEAGGGAAAPPPPTTKPSVIDRDVDKVLKYVSNYDRSDCPEICTQGLVLFLSKTVKNEEELIDAGKATERFGGLSEWHVHLALGLARGSLKDAELECRT